MLRHNVSSWTCSIDGIVQYQYKRGKLKFGIKTDEVLFQEKFFQNF